MKIFSEPKPSLLNRSTILDPYGVPLTNERTDTMLLAIADAQYRIISALEELTEAGKSLALIKQDSEQSSRFEVRYAIGNIFKTWDYIRKQTNFEYANPLFYDIAGGTTPYGPLRSPEISYELLSSDVFTIFESQYPSSIVGPSSDLNLQPLIESNVTLSGIYEPTPVETVDDPNGSNPAAKLIGIAKQELKSWLSCGSVELAQLLGMSRQTLHDADNPHRRPQGRTAAKILDVHAMLSAYISEDLVSRLAWLRGGGRTLWSAQGLDAFINLIEEKLFPAVASASTYSVSVESEREPEARAKIDAPRYEGPKRRF